MGYTFRVGNAVPEISKDDFPYLSAEWRVQGTSHPDAPTFPGDEMTGNGNGRSPSYTVWSDFCRTARIYSLFYDEYGNLHSGHPGCIGIDQDFADDVKLARVAYEAKATMPPGFEGWEYDGPPRYDYNLARIIWLDWWVQWAIANCETPAISNT